MKPETIDPAQAERSAPAARNEMTNAEFNAMMQAGLSDAKADCSRPASAVFEELRKSIRT